MGEGLQAGHKREIKKTRTVQEEEKKHIKFTVKNMV